MKLEEAQRFALEENFDVIVSVVAGVSHHEPCWHINRAPLLCLASGSKVGKPIVTPARDVIGKGQPKCSKTMAQYHNLKAEGVLQWTDMSCTRGKDNEESQARFGRTPQVWCRGVLNCRKAQDPGSCTPQLCTKYVEKMLLHSNLLPFCVKSPLQRFTVRD